MLALSHDQIRRVAPSVFAATPYHAMSDRYRFVPTIEVVDLLSDQGFLPVLAAQSKSRIPGKGEFTKHMLRFRRATDMQLSTVGNEIPELVLVNSHDGTAAYKFMAGVFRMVCSNGMIVQSQDMGNISVKHQGASDFTKRIIDVTATVTESMPRTLERVNTFKQIQLSAPQQNAFAEAAVSLRDNANVRPAQLLASRRYDDRPAADGTRDLWTTLNAVQENMIKGGLRGFNQETRKRSTTRPIKGVDADVKTNKALWMLAERMAELVA